MDQRTGTPGGDGTISAITAPRREYEKPRVKTYGTLSELTSGEAMFGMSPLAQGALSLSPAMMPGGESPGGGGAEVLGDSAPSADGAPGADGSPGAGGSPGADGSPGEAEAGAAGEGGSEGELPFTGFGAAAVSAVGGTVAAAGVALRRITTRQR